MKCFPVIRGCGYVKVPVGLVFICVGVWLLANPLNFQCGHMAESCAAPVEDMLKTLNKADPNYNVGSKESEIQAYCNCVQQCPNYFVVYEQVKTEAVPTNCFNYMASLGIPIAPTNTRRLSDRRLGDGGQSLPGFAKNECQSCEDLEGHAKTLVTSFGISQLVIGIVILLTAGCEHLEMKWQSPLFSSCVIITDFAAGAACTVSIFVSGFALFFARASCNSGGLESSITDGGNDSAQNPDAAAEMAKLLLAMLQPVVSNICESKVPLIVYHVSSWLGVLTLFVTAISSMCVCMRCSDDGKDGMNTPDDMRALTMQQLHENGNDQF